MVKQAFRLLFGFREAWESGVQIRLFVYSRKTGLSIVGRNQCSWREKVVHAQGDILYPSYQLESKARLDISTHLV